jgi:hypothetical protein
MTRARDVADTQENNGGGVPPFVAGKNAIINGDFGVWQRGTSLNIGSYQDNVFAADRFYGYAGSGTATMSRQTFTPGTAPTSGYEYPYNFQWQQTLSAANIGVPLLQTKLEDVRLLAGQTATFSFWAKANAALTISSTFSQNFGSGGSSGVTVNTTSHNLTTSYQRFTATFSVPSISGKTIGTNSFFKLDMTMPSTGTYTINYFGFQLEAGNVATPFTTATGTVQGELAACQRYCYVVQGNATNATTIGTGYWNGTTNVVGFLNPKTRMRATPTLIFSSVTDFRVLQVGVSYNNVSAIALASENNADRSQISFTTTGGTNGQASNVIINATATAFIGLVAEL